MTLVNATGVLRTNAGMDQLQTCYIVVVQNAPLAGMACPLTNSADALLARRKCVGMVLPYDRKIHASVPTVLTLSHAGMAVKELCRGANVLLNQ